MLLAWVAEIKGFRNHLTARSWLVNTLGIAKDRIDSDPSGVYAEIKDKVN
jgi:hypothetical protein